MERIYLDYNATTPLYHKIKENINNIIDKCKFKNPSSIHYFGQQAKYIMYEIDDIIKEKISANNYYIVHTGSCTEANNQIIQTFKGIKVFVSATEHHSVLEIANINNSTMIPVDKNGLVNCEQLDNILSNFRTTNPRDKFLCSIMMVNNETGIIQNIRNIAEIVHKYQGLIHSDIAQAVVKIPLNLDNIDVDYATFSGHKIYAGQCGVLLYKKKAIVKPMIYGGGQQKYLRAGTENILALLFLKEVFDNYSEIFNCYNMINEFREKIESAITVRNKWDIIGKEVDRVSNTIGLIVDNDSTTQLIKFDSDGFAVSAGSACNSGQLEPSHVIKAMGYNHDQCKKFIRISLGIYNTQQEIDKLLQYINNT